jgi:glutathione S-transferase
LYESNNLEGISLMKAPQLTLVIGDKNYSSWSMRPWLALKQTKLPFREISIKLDTPTYKREINKYSPSGKVPVLIHGRNRVWDSLAICEYIAELAPASNLWPQDPGLRAIARSIVGEMHSGFTGLRSQLSMDIKLRMQLDHLEPQTVADIKRILHVWHHSIRATGGPYLLGKEFGIADAFFAPVVMRLLSYGIEIKNENCLRYIKSISQHHAVREWIKAAKAEIPHHVVFS